MRVSTNDGENSSPADELRAAAEKLRALAVAASTTADGTPTAHWNVKSRGKFQSPDHSLLCGDYITNGRGERVGWPLLHRGGSQHRPTYMATQHAEYAATVGPTVGLALAAWLTEASTIRSCAHGSALAVARAINRSGT
ncbi:hypothetical protein [Streptomyces sp. NPDC017941]|uniref:hypothetical protein n=1 Tax=Streptomyces sp. NPDC017941 TaxID=3365018 RepID=UPI00379739DC